VSIWTKGPPTKEGTYWIAVEDQGGWPCIVLCVVEKRMIEGAPQPPLYPNHLFYNDWEKTYIRLMYLIPESFNPLLSSWHLLSSMDWRVSHHMEIERPSYEY
jgi:hypothetical protein